MKLVWGRHYGDPTSYSEHSALDTEDVISVAAAFPHMKAAEKLFRERPQETKNTLLDRYHSGDEQHIAAAALGYFHLLSEPPKARKWLETALEHPDTTPGKRKFLAKTIQSLN